MLWLYLFILVVCAFPILRILANERQQRQGELEYQHQVKLHQELMELRRHGRI